METVKKLPQKDKELCAIICRNIWLRRNSFVFEEKFKSPNAIMNQAASQLDKFQEAQLKATKCLTRQPEPYAIKKWQPPNTNTTKANWDVSLNS